MGLDAIEIVWDIEKHFGITMSDSEAQSLCTVGDAIDLIRQRILAAEASTCAALPCFLALRHTTRDIMSDETLRLRPSTRIVDALLPKQRKELWRRVPTLMESEPSYLFSLRHSRSMRRTLVYAGAIGTLVCFFPLLYDVVFWPLSLLAAVIYLICLALVARPFQTEPPEGLETFGDLTNHLAGRYVATKRLASADPDRLLAEIRPILVNILSVKESEVVPSARFAEDLGMG